MLTVIGQVQEILPIVAKDGIAVAVLLWFMFRQEKRSRALEVAVDRMAKASLLQLISVDELKDGIREQAQQLLDEIDTNEKRSE